jgi:hypothetical protein
VVLLENWVRRTTDVELRAGLETQLIDDRRHLQMIGEELRRLGSRPSATKRDSPLSRAFTLTNGLPSDLYRLSAFHRGIKSFTLNRCGHLLPIVADETAVMLDRVTRDDEGHIRWAEIRLGRLLTFDDIRAASLLTSRIRVTLESAWEKAWRELNRGQRFRGIR